MKGCIGFYLCQLLTIFLIKPKICIFHIIIIIIIWSPIWYINISAVLHHCLLPLGQQ